jgi:hypothetical protein
MTEQQRLEFNHMASILNEVQEMFSALDEYRNSQCDKRLLFKAGSYERAARKLMKSDLGKEVIPQQLKIKTA